MKMRLVVLIMFLVIACLAMANLAVAQPTPSYYFCLDPKDASSRAIERALCDQQAETLCISSTIPVGFIKPEICNPQPDGEECGLPECVEGLKNFGCYIQCVGGH